MRDRETSTPAYMRIRQYVMSQVNRSSDPNQKILSVRELAKLYDVSPPTASKALKQLIREGVLISKHGLGTFINPNRRQKKAKGCVGLIMSSGLLVHYDRLYMMILSGIYEVLSANNLTALHINSGNQGKVLAKEIDLLELDGIIWTNSGLQTSYSLDNLEQNGHHVVSLNFHKKGSIACIVSSDLVNQGKAMAEHLFSLGHRQIIWALQETIEYGEEREALLKNGIESAFHVKNMNLDKRLFLPCENLEARLETLIDMEIPFTAIGVVASHYHTVVDVLKNKGLRVPEDVSIITEDELSLLPFGEKTPTRVTRPLKELGQTAAQTMIDLINDKCSVPLDIDVAWELIAGETCRHIEEG